MHVYACVFVCGGRRDCLKLKPRMPCSPSFRSHGLAGLLAQRESPFRLKGKEARGGEEQYSEEGRSVQDVEMGLGTCDLGMEEKLPQGRGHPMATRQEEELADQKKLSGNQGDPRSHPRTYGGTQ